MFFLFPFCVVLQKWGVEVHFCTEVVDFFMLMNPSLIKMPRNQFSLFHFCGALEPFMSDISGHTFCAKIFGSLIATMPYQVKQDFKNTMNISNILVNITDILRARRAVYSSLLDINFAISIINID